MARCEIENDKKHEQLLKQFDNDGKQEKGHGIKSDRIMYYYMDICFGTFGLTLEASEPFLGCRSQRFFLLAVSLAVIITLVVAAVTNSSHNQKSTKISSPEREMVLFDAKIPKLQSIDLQGPRSLTRYY